jgi:hypothetical protein
MGFSGLAAHDLQSAKQNPRLGGNLPNHLGVERFAVQQVPQREKLPSECRFRRRKVAPLGAIASLSGNRTLCQKL